ncbi:GntR family transcriptional regulator [Glaciibacter superstes]|uniref:GntR family transcriptional regulator n=1 Tax=Glaciibacter superstes TaxID=501023 RepID=UPI0003B4855B|nr:GntR family transcriptional regulator [Glaciibacter superstes]
MNDSLYKQVYDKLREDIARHRFPVGERLPSAAELTAEHKVSSITLKRALDLLRDDGLIIRRPRIGTIVVSDIATSTPDTLVDRPLIGCVITSFDDTFGTQVVNGLLSATESAANLVLKRSLGDPGVENRIVLELIESGAQALILQPGSSEYVPPAVLELITRRFPVVILDRVFAGVPVSTVCSNNIAGSKMATEHLITLGHTHIGLVTTASRVSTAEDRRDGFLHAHATAHILHDDGNEFREVQSTTPNSDGLVEDDIANLMGFLSAHPDLTGFVTSEYNIAVMLKEAARRIGKRVPDDISIVCFDHPDSVYDPSYFRFTHVRQQQQEMGTKAVERILELFTDPGTVKKVSLTTELVLGQSTAAI